MTAPSSPSSKKIAWLSPWYSRSGIATYSQGLYPAVEAEASARGLTARLIPADAVGENRDLSNAVLLEALHQYSPQLIHIQHEYGHWGGKNPPAYRFPEFMRALRAELPHAKIITTAHTVIPPGYRFPIQGGWKGRALRTLLNGVFLNVLSQYWHEKTWGSVDEVVVHSELQIPWVRPYTQCRCIPHYVPAPLPKRPLPPQLATHFETSEPTLLVFGFITPAKGHLHAIELLAQIRAEVPQAQLIFAGEPRTAEDHRYAEECRKAAQTLGLENRVSFTGFVATEDLPALLQSATLVLAPFRETTGSGSIPTALSYGAPVLATDLPLNRDLERRTPGCLGFLTRETLLEALTQPEKRETLRAGARRYAEQHSLAGTARAHVQLYQEWLRS